MCSSTTSEARGNSNSTYDSRPWRCLRTTLYKYLGQLAWKQTFPEILLIICMKSLVTRELQNSIRAGASAMVTGVQHLYREISARWVPWFTSKCDPVRYTLKQVVERLLHHRLQPSLLNWRNNFRDFDSVCSHRLVTTRLKKNKWKTLPSDLRTGMLLRVCFAFIRSINILRRNP